jgi:hypothetical protein
MPRGVRSARNWLPAQDVTRTRLSCLTEREAHAVHELELLVAQMGGQTALEPHASRAVSGCVPSS